MSAGQYLVACLLTAVTLGGAGLAGWVLQRRFLGDFDGPPAVLAATIAALGTLLMSAQLLGVVGLLNRPALVGLMAVAGVAALSQRPWSGPGLRAGPSVAPAPRWSLVACALGVPVVAAVWLRRSLLGLDLGVGGTDSLWFHMPFASAFAESGSITSLVFTDTEFANAFYPANSELLHATGLVLLGTDTLSPLLNLAWLALLLLAAWCVGRPYAAAPLTCLGAAALAVLPTLATTQPGDAKNDTLALACTAAAVAFLLQPGRSRAAIALSGLAAGMAVGTKLSFGLPALLLVGVVAAGVPRGQRLRTTALWAGAAAVPALAWFARNLLHTGNPLPYVRDLGPLSLPGPPAAPQSDTEFSVAHYLGTDGVWGEYFLPGLEYAFGPLWWALLPLAGAVLIATVLRGRGPRERALAVAGAGMAMAYLVTPQTAAGPDGTPFAMGINLRYLSPALLVAFLLAPLLGFRHARAGAAGLSALVFASALLGTEPVFGPGYRGAAVAAALALAACAVGVVWLARARPQALAPAACAALALVAIAGWPAQQRHADRAYTRAVQPFSSYRGFDLDSAYLLARELSGQRIGVSGMAGAFWQYPLSFDGRRNTVQYVGARDRRGAFSAPGDCRAWRRALARGRYDYVVTTPRLDPWRILAGGPVPEADWTRSAPGAAAVSQQGGVTVFRLRRPVGTEGCT